MQATSSTMAINVTMPKARLRPLKDLVGGAAVVVAVLPGGRPSFPAKSVRS
jgi:hypothetical protein